MAPSPGRLEAFARRGNSMRVNGIDSVLLIRCSPSQPHLNFNLTRFKIHGGLLQPRAGTARHDAVARGLPAAVSLASYH